MDVAKIAAAGILTAIMYSFVRQLKPEFASLVILGGCSVILIAVAERFIEASQTVNTMLELAGIEEKNVSILMRSLGICVITQFAADICYDNSSSSTAAAIELAGRVGTIILALPMLQTVAKIALGMME
jgi:stage III sporulation protein AD